MRRLAHCAGMDRPCHGLRVGPVRVLHGARGRRGLEPGQAPGIIVAFIASVIWYMADRYAGDRYSAPFYGYWNTAMHFTTFIINAITFAKIKSSLAQRHELERALAETREQLTQLANVTHLCPQCHEPHVPEAYAY